MVGSCMVEARMSKGIKIFLLFTVCCITGCETTEVAEQKRLAREKREAQEAALREAFLERIYAAEAEAWSVLHPLMQEAAEYHLREKVAYTGAVFVSEDFYSEAFQKEVRDDGLGEFVSVQLVIPDSPAQRAGLREGDRILEINGKRTPRGQGAAFFAAKKLKRKLEAGEANTLLVQRGEEMLEMNLVPENGVYYPVIIVASDAVDLHVDGDVIWLGLDMMESIEKGEDLNYLLAYALAKNVMRHPKQKGRNALLGQLLDVAAMVGGVNTGGVFTSMSGNAYSHAFEVEADLIALYLLAAADFEFDSYPDFWENVLRQQNRNEVLSVREEERIEKMRQIIAAIQAKQDAGESIFPEAYLQGDVSEIE